MTGRLSAVIPCAGLSSRMKRFKPLLTLGGRPIIVHVIETLRSASPEEIIAVTGHRADELEAIVLRAGARVARNPEYAQGMFSSVCVGVKNLAENCDAFLLLPADICLVRSATIRRLAEVGRRQPGRIVYPLFLGRRGHPPVIPSDLIPPILAYTGEGGLRAVLADQQDRALEVPVADENILFDMDRPEDYVTAAERFARLHDP